MTEDIKKWIIESYDNKYLNINSCLLITGNSGIGKTHIINKIIEELNLFCINIDINNLKYKNQSVKKFKRSDLSPESLELIKKYYQDDFKLIN